MISLWSQYMKKLNVLLTIKFSSILACFHGTRKFWQIAGGGERSPSYPAINSVNYKMTTMARNSVGVIVA